MMALGKTRKEWENHMRKCAREVGLPDSNRTVIMFLARHPGASQKELADFANKTTAAVNQTVREMCANGYVIKKTDEADQRYTRLFLTEKGNEKAEQMRDRLRRSDEIITGIIGREKEDEIVSILNDICKVIKEKL